MIVNLIKVINTKAQNNNNREERERRERGGERGREREIERGGRGREEEREREEGRKGGREVHVHAQCNKRNGHTQLLRQKSKLFINPEPQHREK